MRYAEGHRWCPTLEPIEQQKTTPVDAPVSPTTENWGNKDRLIKIGQYVIERKKSDEYEYEEYMKNNMA